MWIGAAYDEAPDGAQSIHVADLPPRLRQPTAYRPDGDPVENLRAMLLTVLRPGGRVDRAARALGISRSTVYYALRRVQARRGVAVSEPSEAGRAVRTRRRRQAALRQGITA